MISLMQKKWSLNSCLTLVPVAFVVTAIFSLNLLAGSGVLRSHLSLIEKEYQSYKREIGSISEEKKIILEWDPQSEDIEELDRKQENARLSLIQFLQKQLESNLFLEQKPSTQLLNRVSEIYQEVGETEQAIIVYKKLFAGHPDLLNVDLQLSRIGQNVQSHLVLEQQLRELNKFSDELKAVALENKTDQDVLKTLEEWHGWYREFEKAAIENEKVLLELTGKINETSQTVNVTQTTFIALLDKANEFASSRGAESTIKIKERIIEILDDCGLYEETYRIMLEAAELVSGKEESISYYKATADYCNDNRLYANAINIYKRIIERYPDRPEAVHAQQKVIELYGDTLKQYEKAIEECHVLQNSFEAFRNDAQLHFKIGQLYYLNREPGKAIPEFKFFLKQRPDSLKTKLLLTSCYIQLRNYDQARLSCKNILGELPEPTLVPKIKDIISYTYLQEQRYAEAAIYSKKSETILNKVRNTEKHLSSKKFEADNDQPNIVFISIDTLRADHVHCLGYHRDTTPTIDRLAREGCLFSKLQATSSWTVPTHASMFTGVYPLVHKCVTITSPIAKEIPTLAEILSQAGYKTAAFSSSPSLNASLGFDRGFNLFDNFSVDMWLDIESTLENKSRKRLHNTESSSSLTRAILSWLDNNHEKKFFLFALYFDPHYNYCPITPYDTMYDSDYEGTITGDIAEFSGKPSPRDIEHIKALYDGEIRFTDEYVGQIVDYLEKLGHKDDTVIVVLSDHGDEFWEHDGIQHGRTLYQEVLWVPMVIWYPRLIPSGIRVDDLISHIDVMPTILNLAGINPPTPINGRNLADVIHNQTTDVFRKHAISELDIDPTDQIHQRSIYNGTKKLIYSNGLKQSWLFDLDSDPNEVPATEYDPIFGLPEFDEALDEWQKSCNSITDELGAKSEEITLDPATLERLKDLGYVQ